MNIASKKNTKEILKEQKIKPIKGFGQNFLISKFVIKKIIKTADLKPFDVILEIGPGIGTLTKELTSKVKKIIAVEKDPKMISILKNILNNSTNVKIIEKDILKISDFKFLTSNYKIVANLAFYLTAPVIRKFLEIKNQPKEMVLIIQKEVAQRICAKPPKMNILAVSIQIYAKPEIISYISKKSFFPKPKVDSAIIKITPFYKKSNSTKINPDIFFKLVKAGFFQPRKQILNNFSKKLKINKEKISLWLIKNKIQPNQRAETLTISDWIKLTKDFKNL